MISSIWLFNENDLSYSFSHLLTIMCMQVGSGKSSLLNLILGEMKLVNGSIHVNGSTAYVPQVDKLLLVLDVFSWQSILLFSYSFSFITGPLDSLWNYPWQYFIWEGLWSKEVEMSFIFIASIPFFQFYYHLLMFAKMCPRSLLKYVG